MEDESITFDEMVEYKHSTHMELADRLLPDLIEAARADGSELVRAAADVLEAWDRTADAESRGAVLFLAWVEPFFGRVRGNPFETAWDPADPMGTPHGLASRDVAVQVLDQAATTVLEDYGDLDVPFGEVYRVRRDDLDLPGNGMTGTAGVFRVAWYQPAGDGRHVVGGGDTFVMAVEFGDPIQAVVVHGYGNATQAGSPHRTDQLALFSEKRVRPVWRSRPEIEANLRSREVFE